MKKILTHHNNGDPIYIALSDEMTFDVIHQESSISSHKSIISALEFATREIICKDSLVKSEWVTTEAPILK